MIILTFYIVTTYTILLPTVLPCLLLKCNCTTVRTATFQSCIFYVQIDGKSIDLALARKQHADLVNSLREKTGLDVLELPPDETNALSVFTQVRASFKIESSEHRRKETDDL